MRLRSITLAAMFAAIISIIAPFALPIGSVPLSMQTLIIPLVASLTTTRIAILSVLGYFAVGLAGLPVFAGFHSGLSSFVAPNGGYLLAMLLFPIIIGPSVKRWSGKVSLVVSNIGAALLQLAVGTIWLGLATHLSLQVALSTGFIAFLLPLLIKVSVVVILVIVIERSMSLPIA